MDPVIEQLGSYDPIPNERNEKYLAFNFERIRFWLGQGAIVSDPVAEILGNFDSILVMNGTECVFSSRRRRLLADPSETVHVRVEVQSKSGRQGSRGAR